MNEPDTRTIYMDHAATTPVDPRVVQAMLPFWTIHYGNASSIYSLGRQANQAMEEARRTVAAVLNCDAKEVIFTSCGTESDNLALRGVAFDRRQRAKKNHIITSSIEHHAIGHTVEQLVKQFGFEATFLPVDRYGAVDPGDVERAIRPDTAIISVMYANNEVGAIEPIAEVGAVARRRGIPFHTDAVQAGGQLSLDVQALNVDLLALSAHKFYGPKGVGLLYVRRGTRLLPAQTGGSQERGRRAGTENVPYIVGMAAALELAQAERTAEGARLGRLRDRLVSSLLARIPDAELTGHPAQRLPGHASLLIRGVEAQSVLIALDLAGVAASSGSACASGAPTPSHVLTALGFDPTDALGALRLTLGKENTEADVDFVVAKLPEIVERMRGNG